MLIRSIFFYSFLFLWTILLGILCIPYLFLPNKYIRQPANFWIKGILLLLQKICGITYEIRGKENMPSGPVIIASKHQSAFETLAFFLYFNKSIFIHKKELFYIPIFGQYLFKCKMIAINRKQRTKAMRKMLSQVKQKISEGNTIIIFPEGTRKKPGASPKYKSGIAGIYKEAKTTVVPVAVNSGLYWPKHTFIKNPGNIIVKIMKPIKPNLEKNKFLMDMENIIEEETKKLL